MINNVATDKAVMFFSASSYSDAIQLYNFGIRDILVSYHYLKKNKAKFIELMAKIKADGGCFMTDSGAFSLFTKATDEFYTPAFWDDYIVEYTKFIVDNADLIYCCANMDLDVFVGQDVVDSWNEKYFKPVEKFCQVIYIVHAGENINRYDKRGFLRFKDYASKYEYVGIGSSELSRNERDFVVFGALGKSYNVRIHGFGWTRIPSLKETPFFSVDSTTWLGGVRYGTSYRHDGKNFVVNDHKKKYVRRIDKNLCKKWGIDYQGVLDEKRIPINQYNLVGWLGARKEYLRSANTKLKNKPVAFYSKQVK